MTWVSQILESWGYGKWNCNKYSIDKDDDHGSSDDDSTVDIWTTAVLVFLINLE
jgi:hypothetical protein